MMFIASRSLSETSALVVAVLLVVAVPVAVWLQQQGNVWTDRLWLPNLLNEPPRHSLLYTNGTFLPPVITKDTHLTPADGPVLLPNHTQIPAGVTLIIEPGTNIYVHEFAQLEVTGTMRARGTATAPITFSSNEQNPVNQTWGGIIFLPGSHGELTYTTLHDGSPNISCLTTAQVMIIQSLLEGGSVGFYTTAPRCQLQNSRIQGARTGIVTLPGLNPTVQTTIAAIKKNIQTITASQ